MVLCLIDDVEAPCTVTYSSNYLYYIKITPATVLTAGIKNIAIGVKHPFDDAKTGLRMRTSSYDYYDSFYIIIK